MIAALRRPEPWLLLVGVAAVALWPLSAYALGPTLVPGLVVGAGVLALVAQRPEYGIALALALAPWTNLEVQDMKPMRLVIPALAIGLLLYGAVLARKEGGVRTRRLSGTILLFVAASIASAAQALDPASSLTKVFLLVTAAALFFAVIEVCRDRRQLMVVAGGAVAGLLIAGTHGVYQQAVGDLSEAGFYSGGEIVARVQGAFGHTNQYAGFLAVLIPLAGVMLVNRAFPVVVRALAGASLVVALPALTFTYTRGAFVGLILGSLVWLAFVKPRAAMAVALVSAVAIVTLAPATLKDRFSGDSSGDVTLRQDLWGSAFDIYSQRPLLGVGLSNFSEGYRTLPSTLASASQRRLLHNKQVLIPPHAANQYLNILAEQGVVGLLAFLILAATAVGVAFKGCRVSDPAGRAISIGVGAGLMILAIHSMFEITVFTEISVPLFALLAVVATFVALDDVDGKAARETVAG